MLTMSQTLAPFIRLCQSEPRREGRKEGRKEAARDDELDGDGTGSAREGDEIRRAEREHNGEF